MAEQETGAKPDLQPQVVRRTVLATIAAGYAASHIPEAWATSPASEQRAAFVAVSEYLTGHPVLDSALATRAFDALIADDKDFAGQVESLHAFLSAQKPDPLKLQSLLDNSKPALAALPRKIVKAWYLGIVGDGEHARCIAFENNLMNRAVADHLRPPSYCFGAYGSWAQKPD